MITTCDLNIYARSRIWREVIFISRTLVVWSSIQLVWRIIRFIYDRKSFVVDIFNTIFSLILFLPTVVFNVSNVSTEFKLYWFVFKLFWFDNRLVLITFSKKFFKRTVSTSDRKVVVQFLYTTCKYLIWRVESAVFVFFCLKSLNRFSYSTIIFDSDLFLLDWKVQDQLIFKIIVERIATCVWLLMTERTKIELYCHLSLWVNLFLLIWRSITYTIFWLP